MCIDNSVVLGPSSRWLCSARLSSMKVIVDESDVRQISLATVTVRRVMMIRTRVGLTNTRRCEACKEVAFWQALCS